MASASSSQAMSSRASPGLFKGFPTVPSKGQVSPTTPPRSASPTQVVVLGSLGAVEKRARTPTPTVPKQANPQRAHQRGKDKALAFMAALRHQNEPVKLWLWLEEEDLEWSRRLGVNSWITWGQSPLGQPPSAPH